MAAGGGFLAPLSAFPSVVFVGRAVGRCPCDLARFMDRFRCGHRVSSG